MRDALAPDDLCDRHLQDAQVEPERTVVHVPDVERELLVPGQRVAPVHLAPARDTRPDLVATHLLGRVARQVLGKERARTDEAHVAGDHIEELGELIEARTPQEAAQSGDPLSIREAGPIAFSLFDHGSKLQNGEQLSVQARPLLAEQDRAAHRDSDGDSNKREDRQEHDEQNPGDDKIEQSLHVVLHSAWIW